MSKLLEKDEFGICVGICEGERKATSRNQGQRCQGKNKEKDKIRGKYGQLIGRDATSVSTKVAGRRHICGFPPHRRRRCLKSQNTRLDEDLLAKIIKGQPSPSIQMFRKSLRGISDRSIPIHPPTPPNPTQPHVLLRQLSACQLRLASLFFLTPAPLLLS
jgi:hypothetical protein